VVSTNAESAATTGAAFLAMAVLFDCLDGLMARKLNATSEFGGELDSLADAVSFGVAPAVMITRIALPEAGPVAVIAGIAFACCAAVRLARFNCESSASSSGHGAFTGLPTTGAAAGIFGMLALYNWLGGVGDAEILARMMPGLLGMLAMLMVSRYRYAHLEPRKLPSHAIVLFGLAAPAIVIGMIWNYGITSAVVAWTYVFSGIGLTVGRKVQARYLLRTG